jgi:hypothetical protein
MRSTIMAVLTNGNIGLLEPIPQEWTEGSELAVQLVYAPAGQTEVGPDAPEMSGQGPQLAQEDWETFQATLDVMQREAKDLIRRQTVLGNP